jgi:hypothetical protein
MQPQVPLRLVRPAARSTAAPTQQLRPGPAVEVGAGLRDDGRRIEIAHGWDCAASAAVLHDYDGAGRIFDRQVGRL